MDIFVSIYVYYGVGEESLLSRSFKVVFVHFPVLNLT